jgi:branched-chain amino acid transport system substrate-binding protein
MVRTQGSSLRAAARAGVALVVSATVAAALAACGDDESSAGDGGGGAQDEITIGYVGTLSGPVSFLGSAPLDGVELAVDQLNAEAGSDGPKFRVVAEDDKLDPSQAISATQKLISGDQADVIIGSPHSGMALAMIPATEQAKVVQISPLAASPQLTDPVKPYFYRLWNTDQDISKTLAAYAKERFKSVGLLYETSAFGEGGRDALTAAFEEIGGGLVAKEAFDLNAQDLTPQLGSLRRAGAKAIIVQTQGPQAALAARGLDQLGYDVPIVGHPGLAQEGFPKLAEGAAEGTIVFEGLDPEKPEAKEFIAAYQEEHGAPPFSFYPATGFDAVMLVAEALRSVDYDTSRLQEAMDRVQGFSGVVGGPDATISYSPEDHDGFGPEALIAKRIQDGKLAPAAGE